MALWHYELHTPLGPMRAAFDGAGRLQQLVLEAPDIRATSPLPPREQREAKPFLDRQLAAYLAGKLRTFTVPLDPQGTPQERRVWEAVQGIPYGQVRTPGDLALQLGMDEGVVLMACAANPILLLVPVHRVVCPGEAALARDLRRLESTGGLLRP